MAKIGALHKSYTKVKARKSLPKRLLVVPKKKESLKHETDSGTEHNEAESSTDATVGSLLRNPFKQSTLIDPNQVQKGVSALLSTTKKTEETEQKLFNEDKPIFLQIASMKVPRTPVRFLRILLPNSPFSSDAEICLIVSDLKKKGPKDDEEAVSFYENLLSQKGVSNIKTIIPLHQLKTEYNMFESVRRLVDLYDVFLVEGKISGKVAHILGKIFIKKRKNPTPIKIKGDSLCAQISCALNKSTLHIHSKGDSFTMQVGNTNMNEENIKENIIAAIEGLANEFPGGWENISTLHLKSPTSMSIPIYINLKNKNEVKVPVVKPKRPKAFESVTDEITTFEDAKILVHPDGKVRLLKDDPSKKPLLKKGKKRGNIVNRKGPIRKVNTFKRPVLNRGKPRRTHNKSEDILEKEEENYLQNLQRGGTNANKKVSTTTKVQNLKRKGKGETNKKTPKQINIKTKKRKSN